MSQQNIFQSRDTKFNLGDLKFWPGDLYLWSRDFLFDSIMMCHNKIFTSQETQNLTCEWVTLTFGHKISFFTYAKFHWNMSQNNGCTAMAPQKILMNNALPQYVLSLKVYKICQTSWILLAENSSLSSGRHNLPVSMEIQIADTA